MIPKIDRQMSTTQQLQEAITIAKTDLNGSREKQHIVLFYRYHPLSDNKDDMEIYRQCLEKLCVSLELTGRILIGCSNTSEGINGTLAGSSYHQVLYFTYALLGEKYYNATINQLFQEKEDFVIEYDTSIHEFWNASKIFFDSIKQDELKMSSPDDFKWSTASDDNKLFPDLNVKLVKELIGTGGTFSSISCSDTAKGYLTPKEWEVKLRSLTSKQKTGGQNVNNNICLSSSDQQPDTILIDCRNTKEYEIGHFVNSIDPQTTTFNQFPKWVQDHSYLLENKEVLMYCTGGIRCEKASAYIRQVVPNVKSVYHLQGGIHKYLELFSSDEASATASCNTNNCNADNIVQSDKNDDQPLWLGKNFVFDSRVSAEPTNHGLAGVVATHDQNFVGLFPKIESHSNKVIESVVGRCLNCHDPFDKFEPLIVCTVCREPVLVCTGCCQELQEYHCKNHYHLRYCYFSKLELFTVEQLRQQHTELQSHLLPIAVGRKFKQKRATLIKQMERILFEFQRRETCDNDYSSEISQSQSVCRSCGEHGCPGRCWGFFGLKKYKVLSGTHSNDVCPKVSSVQERHSTNGVTTTKPTVHTTGTKTKLDMTRHNFFLKPSRYRDAVSGIRVLPPTTRYVRCSVKGKWCGKSVLNVIQTEFSELLKSDVLKQCLMYGLIRVNDQPVHVSDIADIKLKQSDTFGRMQHWHEPPVVVPEIIDVTKVTIPTEIVDQYQCKVADTKNGETIFYVCNKPSSVPVHPAGPYFWNALTTMIEAQEGLPFNSLKTVHRIDRVTSGLTLFSTSSAVARMVHICLTENRVQKLYLAEVCGQFATTLDDLHVVMLTKSDIVSIAYDNASGGILVDAPVYTTDYSNGLNIVDSRGKSAKSLFKLLKFNDQTNRSYLLCDPITGRNHQLRMHLQCLGFPIVGDVLYGGEIDASNDYKVKALEFMVKSNHSSNDLSLLLNESSCISDVDAETVLNGCKYCNRLIGADISEYFSSAQLLETGHAIRLHALKYKFQFQPNRATNDDNEKTTANVTSNKEQNHESSLSNELVFEVKLPPWGDTLAQHLIDWLR